MGQYDRLTAQAAELVQKSLLSSLLSASPPRWR
jgi:hypothetical protein